MCLSETGLNGEVVCLFSSSASRWVCAPHCPTPVSTWANASLDARGGKVASTRLHVPDSKENRAVSLQKEDTI